MSLNFTSNNNENDYKHKTFNKDSFLGQKITSNVFYETLFKINEHFKFFGHPDF